MMSTFVVNAGRSAVQTRQEVTPRKRVYKLDRKGCAMKGFFGDIFDFNRDGKLDSFEKAAEFAFLSSMTEKPASPLSYSLPFYSKAGYCGWSGSALRSA